MGESCKLLDLLGFSDRGGTRDRGWGAVGTGGRLGGACGRGCVAVGTEPETETGRVRCDWGLGIFSFPDSGFLVSLTLGFATASLCDWGPPSSQPAAG